MSHDTHRTLQVSDPSQARASHILNCIYIYIYIYILCVYRAASHATVQCKYGKHAGHLQKSLLYRLVSKSRQYTAALFKSMSVYK